MKKSKVLFLCTGNSCRSQMAEAIVNARLGNRWVAFSAGTQPSGYVHPLALHVLEEIGIVHLGSSKSADVFRSQPFDLVVTVCDDAAENCPVWLGKGRRIHLGYPDPAKAQGTEEEVLTVFRQVRDDMLEQIPALLNPIQEVELLYFDGCPSWQDGLAYLRQAIEAEDLPLQVKLVKIADLQQAQQERFLGSPSFRLQGNDLYPEDRDRYDLSCRVYKTPEGLRGYPTVEMLRERLQMLLKTEGE